MRSTFDNKLTSGRIRAEMLIVLSLSLGASAVYSILALLERLARDTSLSGQTATLNRPLSQQEVFDFIYQFLSFAFGLAPVALVLFLVWRADRPHLANLGLTFGRPALPAVARDTGFGFVLAAVIGIPGIALYLGAKALDLGVTIVPSALNTYWWTVPMLILLALKAALLEETIVVGYLFDRLKRLGWGPAWIILASALLRGCYHLYQGFGGFIGNIAMGVVFAWVYKRYGRLGPLIVAHWVLDIVSFVGYALVVALWPTLFAL